MAFPRLARIVANLFSGDPGTWRRLRFEFFNRPLMVRLRHFHAVPHTPGLVSIITPTCGRLKTLNEAIVSVDGQTYPQWEHLIVSDGTFASLRQLRAANRETRRRFYATPPIRHFGNHQRNVGILQARGEYLVFLDDDNVLYPDALATMLTGFGSRDVGLVFCPIDYDHAKHGVHGQVLMPPEGFARGEVDSLNAMICRSLVVRCGCWGDSYFADFDLLHKASTTAPTRYLHCAPIGHHR